jgi:protein-S-isoprenylcysteine O-methyltransferase Ste14
MADSVLFHSLLFGVCIAAAISFVALLKIDAPYGHAQRPGWGPAINNRWGWVLMELPALLVFLFFYWGGRNSGQTAALILLLLWLLHYGHRSLIYPVTLPAASPPMPWLIVLLGAGYNSVNGYLQGFYIGHLAPHLGAAWLQDERFYAGIALFAAGYGLNKHSDLLLRRLAASCQSGQMKLPQGGGFRWVDQPNYLGEILTWLGFALASWSLAGLSFAVFTFANLAPRALRKHRWYQTEFAASYPKDRKAIVPFLL